MDIKGDWVIEFSEVQQQWNFESLKTGDAKPNSNGYWTICAGVCDRFATRFSDFVDSIEGHKNTDKVSKLFELYCKAHKAEIPPPVLEYCLVTLSDIMKREFVLHKFGCWRVEKNGDLICSKGLNNQYYVIEAKRLTEDDWVLQMMTKYWCDMNDFIPAYFHALGYALGKAKKKHIKVRVFH